MRIRVRRIRRGFFRWAAILGCLTALLLTMRILGRMESAPLFKCAGKWLVEHLWEQVNPPEAGLPGSEGSEEPDPAYRKYRQVQQFYREHSYLAWYGDEESGLQELPPDGQRSGALHSGAAAGATAGTTAETTEAPAVSGGTADAGTPALSSILSRPVTGKAYVREQLMDYDFLMKHFYSVHTSTTASRQLMDAGVLLEKDMSLPEAEETSADPKTAPQILIYHTHSQEAFKNSEPGQNVVGVGTYLAQLLEQSGYRVYHDTSVYDLKDGKLDRSKAYSYALEGIQDILQKYPSIQVILDIHRDGVAENLHLVSSVDGKSTAQIMFFNGLSQTPEGPVPYLDNPYRQDNLAFSLQMQLGAEAYFPGFARKIYLKGLRYNEHLRPRSALIEVGAQTNTYEEAKNAMEPLAQLLDMVLQGNQKDSIIQ